MYKSRTGGRREEALPVPIQIPQVSVSDCIQGPCEVCLQSAGATGPRDEVQGGVLSQGLRPLRTSTENIAFHITFADHGICPGKPLGLFKVVTIFAQGSETSNIYKRAPVLSGVQSIGISLSVAIFDFGLTLISASRHVDERSEGGQHTFLAKGQVVNILGFRSHVRKQLQAVCK